MFIPAIHDAFFQMDDQNTSTKNCNALHVAEIKPFNLLSQIMIQNTNSQTTVRILNPKTNITFNNKGTGNTQIS